MSEMEIKVPMGKYVVAVSGGVDSMVLLHLLLQKHHGKGQRAKGTKPATLGPRPSFVVAHFNHGIRPDSDKDEEFVKRQAKRYGLPFVAGHGKLGPDASEEQARKARYKFLNEVKQQHKAAAIITAHHQDDLIETAIINMLRGSGRRGYSAIADNPDILRPLLAGPKKQILEYANRHRLTWREDATNNETGYLRNYLRLKILPKLSGSQRRQLLDDLSKITIVNRAINQKIANLLQTITSNGTINREAFIALPNEIAQEVLMHFLRQNGIRQFDKKTVERLTAAIKTARPGTKHNVTRTAILAVTANKALLRQGVGS